MPIHKDTPHRPARYRKAAFTGGLRNSDPRDKLKVLKAVTDGLPPQFSFYGAFGCTGIYRYEP